MSEIYTHEEIKENNGKDGKPLWIIYKSSVYNVTDYIKNHPGGVDLIEKWAGKDATKAFNEVGHSGDASRILAKLKIGDLKTETPIQNLNNISKTNFPTETTKQNIKKEKSLIRVLFCM